ncbi:GNAT family N-acetyltransferase [Nocardioides cynanchi]|uniref:GNAT family N-acetyltransferase n=1 Tax=Nocardioides cynanchi TaxID=2558918 RepID=UPI0012471345|nr:GNAT family N-acetyltransferase [Nocardioides cynanchi]
MTRLPTYDVWPDSAEADDEAITALHELQAACRAEESPLLPVRSRADALGWFRSPPADERRSLWLARDAHHDVVGAAWLACQANATAASEVMVPASLRGQGVGSALLERVTDAARSAGMATLTGACASPAARAFLEHRGAVSGHTHVRQVLDRTRAPASALAGPDAVLPDGAFLASWVSPTPEHLMAAYAVAKDAINDAPMEEFDREVWTGERIRGLEQTLTARGSATHVSTVQQDGMILAFTEIRVSEAAGATAATQDTAVVASARRRGYGAAVKRASLLHLRQQRPDVRFVTTTNDARNVAMLRINRRLGFEPVARYTQLSLPLVPGPASH